MNGAHISLERSFVGLGAEIAALAGMDWAETPSLDAGTIGPPELDRLDPFFDSLGAWNAATRTIVVDVGRCERKRAKHSANALTEIVVAHFCAKAVVHLGIHPQTAKQYVGWNASGKEFSAEGYPLKPCHRFYDPLVREQELFTQIFTHLYLLAQNIPDELAAFRYLSQGHCGLYALNYVGSPDAHLIHSLLVRDWQSEAEASPVSTAAKARRLLGQFTRGVMVDKMDIEDEEIDS